MTDWISESPLPQESPKITRTPIPVYDPKNQISVTKEDIDLFNLRRDTYPNPELFAIERDWTTLRRESRALGNASGHMGNGLEWAVLNTNREVGRHFQTHGFGEKAYIVDLNNILKKGVDKQRTLYTMPFIHESAASEAFGADMPHHARGIYLIPGHDQTLEEGVAIVGIGEGYIRGTDLLSKLYPEVKFVPWNDLPRVLTEIHNKKTGEHLEYAVPTDENRPWYLKRDWKIPRKAGRVTTPLPLENTGGNEDDVW